jgi:excisionase family DNA binding protein
MAKSVTLQTAAEEMSVSVDTIERLIASKQLQAHRVGRAIRVYAESIEAYQRRQEVLPAKTLSQNMRRAHKKHLHAVETLSKLGVPIRT